WAASVLLAILIAGTGFLELSGMGVKDIIIVIIGFILIAYGLIAVFFTYKYRSALNTEETRQEESKQNTDKEMIKADLEKEKLKLEKKKAKNEAKKAKKESKRN
ncbi:MAG TPA: hypothetical protein PLQ82_04250, partial [Desulfobacteraceae bacterium]|nr:hypothetical protein [Desulfobacteraceae bacterium]